MDRDNSQAKTYFELGWVAAILDGEGWLILNRQLLPSGYYRYVPVIGMNTTSQKIVNRYVEILKSWNVGCWVGERKFLKTQHKNQFVTNVRGFERCNKLLKIIQPYLIEKRTQGEVMMNYIAYRQPLNKNDHCGEVEEKYFLTMQNLNQTGKASTT